MEAVPSIERLGVHQAEGDKQQTRRNLLITAAMALLAFVWLIPIAWTLSLSFRPEDSITANLTLLLPTPFTSENYDFVFRSSRIPRWFLNSLIVASARTFLQLMICSLAAYSFARVRFPFRQYVFYFVLIGLMVPGQATFIPVYLLFSNLKLLNSFPALIVPGVASPFAVFLLVQFFKGIPIELEEAARLDGASRIGVYWRIFLPLSTPVLTALAIFTFLGTWNEYLWPLVAATDPDVMTITIGLTNLTATTYTANYGETMAAAWTAGLPIVFFFFVFQKRIISGIQISSGIK